MQNVDTATKFIARSEIPKASAMRMLTKLKEEDILLEIRNAKGSRPAILVFDKLMDIFNG
jgi:hypothetical protein